MNLHDVAQTFATEEDAVEHLVRKRWPEGVRCVKCESERIARVSSLGKTGKGRRGLFVCLACDYQFTATSGTLFHDSHLPLRKWFMAIALICEAKKGLSALQLSRHLGVQHKTAWYLFHRIRNAMAEANPTPLGGQGQIVEIDESYLGGTTRRKGVKAAKDAKIKVLGLAERGGRLHLQVIDNAKAASIRPVLEAKLDPETPKVVTDANPTYSWVLPREKHEEVVNKDLIRKRGFSGTYSVDSAIALFKRGFVGSYHKLSKDHLDSYLQEFCWRFNRRHIQPDVSADLKGSRSGRFEGEPLRRVGCP